MSEPTLYVIMREVGEYDDRYETAIRYVLTEAEAKAAVERAELEGKTLKGPPYPDCPPAYNWFRADGTEVGAWEPGATFLPQSDHEARAAQSEAMLAAYRAECLAMNCVDPGGPCDYATYSYEAVTRVPDPKTAATSA